MEVQATHKICYIINKKKIFAIVIVALVFFGY